jgi:tRNA dimethylallyltransferase
MNYLVTIIGPTAIGKTALSIALAQHYDCSIVSCDSRQFYKEMRIGTAVPTALELAGAPHYFIQNKSVHDSYSVGDFEQEALTVLDRLFTENNIQIMVGGSGLYVDAVLKGFDDFPTIDESIRIQLNTDFESLGITYLQDKLKELDPVYYQRLAVENPQTLQNPQRMKRFVEVCLGSGQPYSSFLGLKASTRSFTPIVIALEADRAVMYDRINRRVDLMMAEGLLAEAEALYPLRHLNALQTVGYRELFDYLDGTLSLDAAVADIKTNTRRFAKRQLTWFKRTEQTQWFDYQTALPVITSTIDRLVTPTSEQ